MAKEKREVITFKTRQGDKLRELSTIFFGWEKDIHNLLNLMIFAFDRPNCVADMAKNIAEKRAEEIIALARKKGLSKGQLQEIVSRYD